MNEERVHLLEGAAATFAVLGMLLYQEPTKERISELLKDEFFSDIPFADDDAQIAEGCVMLDAWAHEAAERDLTDVVTDLNREWLRLLVGYGEPKAPPWAAYYFEKDPVIFGSKTLEVRHWYARYGLELERKYHEPDDHLGLMLQFLALLISKENEAQKTDDVETARHYQQEQKNFLEQNLLSWVPHWQTLMTDEARNPFYRGLALLINGTLRTFSLQFR
jgi:TorA maturation chaperone TorD